MQKYANIRRKDPGINSGGCAFTTFILTTIWTYVKHVVRETGS
jgi:hypothetical protein